MAKIERKRAKQKSIGQNIPYALEIFTEMMKIQGTPFYIAGFRAVGIVQFGLKFLKFEA